MSTIVAPAPKRARSKKGLPKRLSRPGYLAQKARYNSEHRREKNRAGRIVRDALRSKDPRGIAVRQAKLSRHVNGIDWTVSFVEKILNRKGL